MSTETDTYDRIIRAAGKLFMIHGFKRTSIDEIAQEAGVTRVTIYRYCADKHDLVRAVVLQSEDVFDRALETLSNQPDANPRDILNQIGQGLAALPRGDLPARIEELARIYPDLYAEMQQNRLRVQGELFSRLFDLCERHGLLRPGLNRDVARAIIWELLVNLLRSPSLTDLGLSDSDMFEAVTDFIAHGIITEGSGSLSRLIADCWGRI
jgi:AcrR family transcriptional regulator